MDLELTLHTTTPMRTTTHVQPAVTQQPSPATSSDWREQLPVLTGSGITLRDLRMSDSPSLLALPTSEEVTRFILPPPTTLEGFERFLARPLGCGQAGGYVSLGV